MDQRKIHRIPKQVPVSVTKLSYPMTTADGEPGLGTDISLGGIRFLSPVPYEIGAILSLKIELAGWQGYRKPHSLFVDMAAEEPFSAVGEVVWCREPNERLAFEIGIKFVNVYDEDLRALERYLNALEK